MDKLKSIELEKELKNRILNGFKVLELINNGKSAAVFKAEKNGELFALKIFDNELIERFGHEIQTKRIEQEISLKNHTINNLVKIYEGGNTIVGSQTYYFIVMELINGLNLKDYIQTKNYTQDFIVKVLEKLTETTEQLIIQKQIAHRDIKPENIMVDENDNIILMDLGVLKLIGAKSFSDDEEKSFVGTLRYAAPEFLLRTEDDSVNGWSAVNIYQIGATLHDLIMKTELFSDKTPYTNLVIAIKDDTPKISNSSIAFELIQLTRDMLTKDWKKRLSLITKERLKNSILIKEKIEDLFDESIEQILKMRLGHQAKFDEIEKLQRSKTELRQKQKDIALSLIGEIEKCFSKIKEKGVCKEIKKSPQFHFENDRRNTDSLIQNCLFELQGDLKMGFPRNLYILVRISNDEDNYSEIEILGVFPSAFTRPNIDNPLNLFQELSKEQARHSLSRNTQFSFKTINIFKGIVDFDEAFTNYLSTQLVKLITKSLKAVEKNVEQEIEWHEKIVKSKDRISSRITEGHKTIMIDRI